VRQQEIQAIPRLTPWATCYRTFGFKSVQHQNAYANSKQNITPVLITFVTCSNFHAKIQTIPFPQ
jgi:hypothetical protein